MRADFHFKRPATPEGGRGSGAKPPSGVVRPAGSGR